MLFLTSSVDAIDTAVPVCVDIRRKVKTSVCVCVCV